MDAGAFVGATVLSGLIAMVLNMAGQASLAATVMVGGIFVVGPILGLFVGASTPPQWPHLRIIEEATPLERELEWELDRPTQRITAIGFHPVALGISGSLGRGIAGDEPVHPGYGSGTAVRAFIGGDGSTLCYVTVACVAFHGQYASGHTYQTTTTFLTPVEGGWVVTDNDPSTRGPIAQQETGLSLARSTLAPAIYAAHQRLLQHSGRRPCGVGDLSDPYRWAEQRVVARRAAWVREGWAIGDPAAVTLDPTFKGAVSQAFRNYWFTGWIPAIAESRRRSARLDAIGGHKPLESTLPSAAPAAQPR